MSDLDALIADGNSAAARRIRVRLQPRDKRGRWVPTGAAIIANIKGMGPVRGKAIGGTATKKGELNKIRMLVDTPQNGIKKNTVLEVDPKNGELETGIRLSRDFLKSKGIDPDLKHTLPEDLADQPEDLKDMNPQPADDLDIELAQGGLDAKEDLAFRAERNQEPLAKLPPALAERAVEGKDVKDIVDGKLPRPPKPGEKSVPEDATPPKDNKNLPTPPEMDISKLPDDVIRREATRENIENNRPGGRPDGKIGTGPNQNKYLKEAEKRGISIFDPVEAQKAPAPTDVSGKPKPPSITPEKKPLGTPPRFPGDKGPYDVPMPIGRGEGARAPDGKIYLSDEHDSAIKEVWDTIYGGEEKVSLDKVIGEASGAEEVAISDLKPGDIISLKNQGNRRVVEVKPVGGEGDVELYVDDYGRRALVGRVPGYAGIKRLRKAEDAPAAEKPTPEAPSTPEAPNAPEDVTPEVDAPEVDAPEDVVPDEIAPEDVVDLPQPPRPPRNFPPTDRLDDGKEFALEKLDPEAKAQIRKRKLTPIMGPDGTPEMFVDENGKLVEADDPFEMMNAIAEAYPNAKFTPDGSLVLHRQKDKDGRIFELRADNTGKKAVAFSIMFTDPKTGKSSQYFYKNDHHGISAAFGKYDAEYILDRLLGDDTITFGNSKTKPGDSIARRAKLAFLSGPIGDPRRKFVTVEENAVRLAEGRNAILHKNGTIHHSEIPSLWDSFTELLKNPANEANKEDFYHVMRSIFGRIPMTDSDHARAMRAIRDADKKLFPDRSGRERRSFNAYVTTASEQARGIYRNTDMEARSIKYASKDRSRPLEKDMVVEYENNVKKKSTLKVVRFVENVGVTRGDNAQDYNYGDYVIVQDANGNYRKINSLRLQILKDQKTELTSYSPNLSGKALADARRALGEYGTEGEDLPEITKPVGVDQVLSDVPSGPMLAEDFTVGDTLPDKNGAAIGEIISMKPITSKSGKPGYAFLVKTPDGDEVQVAYSSGMELELKKA